MPESLRQLPQPRSAWSSLAILLLATAGAAGLGSLASINASEFYAQLLKPDWAPPGNIFGPVWTALYLLMALAAWLVVNELDWQHAHNELTAYFVQLALNALWSWLFFFWHAGTLALLDIGLLWCAIVYTMVLFWRARPAAALLLIPYLLWVSFATVLNWSVVGRNPGVL